MDTTWMCDNGYHGSASRRYMEIVDGRHTFVGMYEGNGCAGTVFRMDTQTQTLCECDCHAEPEYDFADYLLAMHPDEYVARFGMAGLSID
jgi:hypothetical protein